MAEVPDNDREIVISFGELTEVMSEVGAVIISRTRSVFGDEKADEVMNLMACYAAQLAYRLFDEEKLEVEK